jgi:hypothetical protein
MVRCVPFWSGIAQLINMALHRKTSAKRIRIASFAVYSTLKPITGVIVTLTDIAAIVGALAWLPPIFIAVRNWMTRPQIRVITQPSPEIGFTSVGTILNLRIALTVTHKDIVITGIRLKIKHESGEEMALFWRGIVQNMGTMKYPQLGSVPFEKELNVLAMKVSLKDVEERFIRFQNVDFLQKKAALEAATSKTMSHLRKSEAFDGSTFIKSSEMADLYSLIKQSFSWKPGGYQLEVLLESPDAFSVLDNKYSFTLSPHHVQNLSSNLSHIEQDYANQILPAKADEALTPIQWNWVYPDMPKVTTT